MSYIGTPPSNAFTSLLKQDFSTSATTGYTLDHAVNNANDIALFINFVRQEPTAGYAASGTTLTLTSATASSDDMYCVYLGKAVQTVNPPNASVGLSQLTASGTKDATTFLRGDNTFAVAGGTNTPSFQAYASSNQSQTNDTFTKIQCNTEDFDVGSNYDHSTNYRFTPTTSGKYYIYGQAHCNAGSGNLTRLTVAIYKNGTDVAKTDYFLKTSSQTWTELTGLTQTIESANGSSDYFELYARLRTYNGSGITIEGGAGKSFFGAYKIIE